MKGQNDKMLLRVRVNVEIYGCLERLNPYNYCEITYGYFLELRSNDLSDLITKVAVICCLPVNRQIQLACSHPCC